MKVTNLRLASGELKARSLCAVRQWGSSAFEWVTPAFLPVG